MSPPSLHFLSFQPGTKCAGPPQAHRREGRVRAPPGAQTQLSPNYRLLSRKLLILSNVTHWVVLEDCHKQGGRGSLTLTSRPRWRPH